MSKKALGKGIDALFLSPEEEVKAVLPPSGTTVLMVPVDRVKQNPFQPRKRFNEEALQELSLSIAQQGILQPILAEKLEDFFIIVAGERRYRAALMAGLTEVPLIVKEFTEEEKLEIALIENLQREDLTPLEEAKAIKAIIDKTGLSQESIAEKLGKNRSTIANSLRLLKLPQEIQESLDREELTPGHARAILSLVNPADQQILFKRILKEELSVRKAEELALQLSRGSRAAENPVKEKPAQRANLGPELLEMEQQLIDSLGTKVAIRGNGKSGKIEISYFSMEDLERVLSIITK